MCELKDYPYLATWFDTPQEAEQTNEYGMNGWIHWNGVSMIPPKFMKLDGKIYTYDEFKKLKGW